MANENLSPMVMSRIMKEVRGLCKSPPDGIKITWNEEDLTTIFADIEGPAGTPFEGGNFQCKILLGQEFPQAPPKGYFITKVFHPNVSKIGEICVNTLKKDWKPEHGLAHILLIIKCLLIHPNPDSALNEDAGKLLMENYDDFAARARMMTKIHAKPNTNVNTTKELDTSKGTSDDSTDLKKEKATGAITVQGTGVTGTSTSTGVAGTKTKIASKEVASSTPNKKKNLKRL